MTARRIDGKKLALEIQEAAAHKAQGLIAGGTQPTLALMRVGEDPASIVYLKKKAEACQAVGVRSQNFVFDADADPGEVRRTMADLNQDPEVHGILLQLPLPKGWDAKELLELMDPKKDVDGFHPVSVGRLCSGDQAFVSCTPLGILYMLHQEGVNLQGKHVAVIGRSNVVGRPLANLLSQKGQGRDATVTMIHSRSQNPQALSRQADVVVAAAGQVHMVTPEFVKPGAVVIDVGIHRVPNPSKPGKFKLTGDVHPDVAEVASALTPVPGGVGPMTVAMLLRNTVDGASGSYTTPFSS